MNTRVYLYLEERAIEFNIRSTEPLDLLAIVELFKQQYFIEVLHIIGETETLGYWSKGDRYNFFLKGMKNNG